jgi:PTH1 family peptidyl-tRNA hydrolase
MARIKLGGGHGGHNGLRDTIRHCGPDFWRLRLGIGHPGNKDQVIDYVLQRSVPAQEEAIVASIGDALAALQVFLSDGAERAMNQLHSAKLGEET